MRVIIHTSHTRGEYFFSTDHCQEVKSPDNYPDGDFVPITYFLPMSVVPRPSLPSGVVASVKDLLAIFHNDEKEILNPDPKFRVLGLPFIATSS